MRGGAHRLMGIALGGIIISVVKPVLPAAVVVVITSVWGEMTPDIDTVNSTISRRIPIIPRLCNGIFNHTSLCQFYQGRLLLHVTIPFEEKPTSNLPGDNLR